MTRRPGNGEPVPDAVHNEQVKLAATALNNIGVASAVTGGIVPLVTHVTSVALHGSGYWGLFVALWLAVGVCWHLLGRYVLRGLRT
jgi:hypothetical protein